MGEVLVLGVVIGVFYLLSKGNNLVTTPLSSTTKLPSLSSLLKTAAPVIGGGAGVAGTGALVAGGGSMPTAGVIATISEPSVLGTTPIVAGGSLSSGMTATDIITQAPGPLQSAAVSGMSSGSAIAPAAGLAGAAALLAINIAIIFDQFKTKHSPLWGTPEWKALEADMSQANKNVANQLGKVPALPQAKGILDLSAGG